MADSKDKTASKSPAQTEDELTKIKEMPLSLEMDELFKPGDDSTSQTAAPSQEVSLDASLEFQLDDLNSVNEGAAAAQTSSDDAGLDLNLDQGFTLDDSAEAPSLDSTQTVVRLAPTSEVDDLDLATSTNIKLSDIETPDVPDLSFGDDSPEESQDLSSETQVKLKEIDDILDAETEPAPVEETQDPDVDVPLVSDDLNLDELNFSSDESEESEEKTVVRVNPFAVPEKPKKKKREVRDEEDDIREISGAYAGDLERLQATISNLRTDREELLQKIDQMEEEKVLHHRQTLSLRAELDERKIELSIIRRKLNDEIAALKDTVSIHEEKRLILEEKNRQLQQELDTVGQRTKLDVKKIQLRERELEQRLELLKSDAETQIRNRDLKILELKRRIDSMEFDMESISSQEKKSVESRFELEDKLDKAIKTLRSAITVLEEEGPKAGLETLKKNIDI